MIKKYTFHGIIFVLAITLLGMIYFWPVQDNTAEAQNVCTRYKLSSCNNGSCACGTLSGYTCFNISETMSSWPGAYSSGRYLALCSCPMPS